MSAVLVNLGSNQPPGESGNISAPGRKRAHRVHTAAARKEARRIWLVKKRDSANSTKLLEIGCAVVLVLLHLHYSPRLSEGSTSLPSLPGGEPAVCLRRTFYRGQRCRIRCFSQKIDQTQRSGLHIYLTTAAQQEQTNSRARTCLSRLLRELCTRSSVAHEAAEGAPCEVKKWHLPLSVFSPEVPPHPA